SEALFESSFYHQYDYTVSPSGEMVAVSTPDRNGGVYIVNISSGESELVFPNGQHPSWQTDGQRIVAERQGGGISTIDIETGQVEELYELGLYPKVSPDGTLVSFLLTSQQDGFRLVTLNLEFNDSPRETGLGELSNQYVWGEDSQTFFVARHSNDGNSTSIIKGFVQDQGNAQTILNSATSPSFGGADSNILGAINLEESRSRGVVMVQLNSGERSSSSGEVFSVAVSPVSSQFLVETSLGIHLLE
ncbi:hypothetical protein K8I28_05565, partial [bacterium]|nr:hypothetical protein [bacterium]